MATAETYNETLDRMRGNDVRIVSGYITLSTTLSGIVNTGYNIIEILGFCVMSGPSANLATANCNYSNDTLGINHGSQLFVKVGSTSSLNKFKWTILAY